MTTRVLHNVSDRDSFVRLVETYKLPCTVSVKKGRDRSHEQNHTAFMWYSEIAEQKGDETPKEIRAYCKLTLGVPILRADSIEFREAYDRIIRPLTYEQKLAMMVEPLDFPVTRLLTTAQMTTYLDAIHGYADGIGVQLTIPEERV